MEPQSPDPNQPLQPQQMPVQPSEPPQPIQQPASLKPAYDRPEAAGLHPMVVLQPGEQIVATLKRHPFGIVSMYISAVFGLIIAGLLAFVLLPHLLDQYNVGGGNVTTLVYGGLGIVVIGMVVILAVATTVYWQNQWVITTDSITQISQNSLFGRQVSQLSMDNLEDVTVIQDGILPHMFNYGILKAETAGERSKFQFPYCPNPNEYARRILEVHEQFLEERRNIQNRP